MILKVVCSLLSPDMTCIVGSWLDNSIGDSEVAIQGSTDMAWHGMAVVC